MPAANQSLHYNTTQVLIVRVHTQNGLCKASKCNVVKYVCLYDSVILIQCISFKDRLEDPRSVNLVRKII